MSLAAAWFLSIVATAFIVASVESIRSDRRVDEWERVVRDLRGRLTYLKSLPRVSVTCACGHMPVGPATATGTPESCERALNGEPTP